MTNPSDEGRTIVAEGFTSGGLTFAPIGLWRVDDLRDAEYNPQPETTMTTTEHTNAKTGRPYTGQNAEALEFAFESTARFTEPMWLTFGQARAPRRNRQQGRACRYLPAAPHARDRRRRPPKSSSATLSSTSASAAT